MILSQFPKGSRMNPLRRQEYENYKEAQKNLEKRAKWNEFLKLTRQQYLNFRVINKKNVDPHMSHVIFI